VIKQILLLILVGLQYFASSAQDTLYFNLDWKECPKQKAYYFRSSTFNGDLYLIKDYFITGQIQFECLSKTKVEPLQQVGRAIFYRKTGEVLSEKNFENGIENGETTDFYSNNNPKVRHQFKNGRHHGSYTFFYPSGQKFRKGYFNNGLEDGVQTNYSQLGDITSQIEYKDDKPAGRYKVYKFGLFLEREGYFENGRQDGSCFEYHSNGKYKKVLSFKNNLLDGIYTESDFEGNRTSTGYFINGLPTVFETVQPHEDTKDIIKFKCVTVGRKENWQVFKNDTLILDAYYLDGYKVDVWKVYNENKVIVKTIDYRRLDCKEANFIQKGNENIFKDFELAERFKDFYSLTTINDCNSSKLKVFANKVGGSITPDATIPIPVAKNPTLLQFQFNKDYWQDGAYSKTFKEKPLPTRGRLTTIPARKIIPRLEKYNSATFNNVYIGGQNDGELNVKIFFCNNVNTLTALENNVSPSGTEVFMYLSTLSMPTEDLDGKFLGLNYSLSIAEAIRDHIIDAKNLYLFLAALADANEYESQKELFELFKKVQTEKEKLLD
jgi:antitoxin component YwqK of YwqJK toxin-antitoxin module